MTHRPHRPHKFRAYSKPKKINKGDHKHYSPYIPLLILVAGTFLLGLGQPLRHIGVLAYATNVSSSGLLEATNSRRQENGANVLQVNNALSTAAQAKANDMIARNYWSHTTPEGQQPWIFIDSAGYKYQKAGENLAYGFLSSTDTITGWMNSQTHRDNMLDSAFTEVGFGFANGENFNSNGQETVVVAMYGKPNVLAASNQTPAPAPPSLIAEKTTEISASQPDSKPKPVPVTTETTLSKEPAQQSVARIQTITKGNAPWTLFAVGLISGIAIMLLFIKHAAGLRHLLRDSERFVLHHPLLDTVLVSVVVFGSFMSQTAGFIR